jgi:murein DD-endopeptidase MepM/ murein hydrolase activator NlpD
LFKMVTRIVRKLKKKLPVPPKSRSFLLMTIIALAVAVSGQAFAHSNGWPVASGTITSSLGWRLDPFGSGKIKWHNGVDIAVALNTPVTPTGPGLVRFAGWHRDYGWLVVVDHHDGWFTMYGHNNALTVTAGQEVTQETVIAYAGSTGRSTGVHLHYERRWFPEGTKPAPAIEDSRRMSELPEEGIRQPSDSLGKPGEDNSPPALNDNDPNIQGGIGGE